MYLMLFLYTHFWIPAFPFNGILRDKTNKLSGTMSHHREMSDSIHNVNNEKGLKLLL